jgi:HK97 family phage portal protein
MGDSLQLVDSRGKPLEKSIQGGDCGSAEGSWRGPFFGIGELGGIHHLDPLAAGFQRNLTILGQQACPALYAAINTYAQAVATLPIYHIRLLENGGTKRITTSALSRILRSPNYYQHASDFLLNLVFALLSTGNAYAFAIRNDRGEVDSLHLMPSHGTQPYIDPDDQAVFYGLGNNPMLGDLTVMIPARDVLHIRLYTPHHPLIGVSPVRYATTATGINNSISRNQAAFFSNMSRPSGVLSTEEKLTKDQMTALRDAWHEKSRGLNAGDVPILSWGLKWQPFSITSEDAQLIDAYRMSIEDIARVFNVPLMLIGDYQKATYNNSEALMRHWLAQGLGFVLEHIEKSFNKFFRLPADQVSNFDVNGLLRTDFEARVSGYGKAIQSGLYSPNEARALEGLPAVEYGEEPRVQAQVVPLSQVEMASSAPSAPAPSAPTSEDEERTLLEYMRKEMAA